MEGVGEIRDRRCVRGEFGFCCLVLCCLVCGYFIFKFVFAFVVCVIIRVP